MKISIIGSGYVGLVAGACFADTGIHVTCVDNNEEKLNYLKRGEIPFFEPSLSDIIKRNWRQSLEFSSDLAESIQGCDAVFVAVGTPPNEDSSADLSYVLKVAKDVAKAAKHDLVLVLKSTVPVGTNKQVTELVKEYSIYNISVVSNPEFLKEGDAINDFLKPDRIVIGTNDDKAFDIMYNIYSPFVRQQNRIKRMSPESAEIVKYASNAFLATKISFINEIAELCDAVGADVEHVRLGMGADSRIGYSFLYPGLGFGGSCFPKDLRSLVQTSDKYGVDFNIAKSAIKANHKPVKIMFNKIKQSLEELEGKTIAIWGLSFKPHTDDVRESSSLVLIEYLVSAGAKIRATDPEAQITTKNSIEFIEDEYEACIGAEALVIATEWPKYRNPDFEKIHKNMIGYRIYDGRNILNKESVLKAGFSYYAIGR